MESVLMDQSPMNPRRTLAAAVANNNSNIHGRWLRGSSPSSSITSMSQLLINVQAGAGVGLFGSRPPPLYSSLPPFYASPPLKQPPLLPLPFSKSATLPSPSKRVTAAGASVRSRQHQKKPRPSTGSKKEARSLGSARSNPKPVEKSPPAAVKKEDRAEDEEEEEFLGLSLYSISPPPSSLPLPRFSLTRPRAVTAAASCTAEAVGGASCGGGEDSGASDDLRRLLRL